MAKRGSRHATVNDSPKGSRGSANVRALFPETADWDRFDDGGRDQKYVRKVRPQSRNQRRLIDSLERHQLVLAVGPAGTGKTYLAIAKAVEALEDGRVARLVLTRPAVEAGRASATCPATSAPRCRPTCGPSTMPSATASAESD